MIFQLSRKKRESALAMAHALQQEELQSAEASVSGRLGRMCRGAVKRVWGKVERLWEWFRSPDVPKRVKMTIIGALLYLVLPLDALPDAIPGVGLLDDAFVIGTVFAQVAGAVERRLSRTVRELSEERIRGVEAQLDVQLDAILRAAARSLCVYFAVAAVALTVAATRPFGAEVSLCAAGAVLIAEGIAGAVSFMRHAHKSGLCLVTKYILKERDVMKGIADYVLTVSEDAERFYHRIDRWSRFVSALRAVPSMDRVVARLMRLLRRRCAAFVCFWLACALAMLLLARPYTGMSLLELCRYPILRAARTFF